jgi:hypothetical protein
MLIGGTKKGQTIFELIIVIFIASTSLVLFASLLSSAVRLDSLNRERAVANALTIEGIESVNAYSDSDPAKIMSCTTACYLDGSLTFITDETRAIISKNSKDFKRKIEIKNNVTTSLGQQSNKEVTVTVTWTSGYTNRYNFISYKMLL